MGNPPRHFDIRDHREKDWFWANNGIVEWYGEIVGADSIAVYMVLCRHANQAGECWPSYQTIASKLKLSRPTVIKCMKRLEVVGLIAKSDRTQPTKDGGTMPDSNMYLLLTVKPFDEPSKARLLGLVNEIDHPPSKARLPHLVKQVNHPSKRALPKQDSLNKTHRTTPTPSAPIEEKRTPNREMVMMLVNKGVRSEKVANEIASMGLDYVTVEQSIDNLLADGKTTIAAVVGLLRTTPPEPGKPYQRSRAAPKASTPLPTRPVMPPDMLTPAQLAERARAKRAERDTS